MNELTYTLVADGASDRCLAPIITWALTQALPLQGTRFISDEFADYRDSTSPPKGLAQKLRRAVEDFPCDILFVHRDAEKGDPSDRRSEILDAAKEAGVESVVCIIPVRMTEAWLLFDEPAIRQAAGNPHGSTRLKLPALNRVEEVPDPKAMLETALEMASEASGRRLKQFQRDLPLLKLRVTEYIEDFSPLRSLRAFEDFEKDVREVFSRL